MASGDEIAQVCQVEIEGVKIAFNASVQMASWMLQALKALYGKQKQIVEGHKDKKEEKELERIKTELEAPGRKTRTEMLNLSASQGDLPQTLEIPNDCYREVIDYFDRNEIRWSGMIDFNSNRSQYVSVCPQDYSLASIIVKNAVQRKMEQNEAICNEYNKKIDEVKAQLAAAGSDEKERLETLLEHYTQARDEKMDIVNNQKDLAEKGGTISFSEYLGQSKGTSFEQDPLKAVNDMQENGVEIAPAYSVKECLQPVRDTALMPDGKMQFVLPDSGTTITREFDIDRETNLVFSKYSFKTDSGEMYDFTDRNVTKKHWNETVLPNFMDKAEITEEMKCRVFTQPESLEAYLRLYASPKEEFGQRDQEETTQEEVPDFQNADVKRQIEHAVSEEMKASAPLEVNTIAFEVPADSLYMENGKFIYRDTDMEMTFSSVTQGDVKDGKLTFAVHKDAEVELVRRNGKEDDRQKEKISAGMAKTMLSGEAAEAERGYHQKNTLNK